MDDISQATFGNGYFKENLWISIKIAIKFVPKGLIDNIPASAQIMAWRRPGVDMQCITHRHTLRLYNTVQSQSLRQSVVAKLI